MNIASKEYTTNPRKIIQFLNNFQAERFLIKQQEDAGYIQTQNIENKLEFICKLIIIKEEWHKLYKEIFDNYKLLDNINNFISQTDIKKENGFFTSKNNQIKLNENQYRFFRRTQYIKVPNIEAFLLNRQMNSDIPSEIFELIDTFDWHAIKPLIKDEKLSFEKLFILIKQKYETEYIKRNLIKPSILHILSLIFQIIKDNSFIKELKNILFSSEFAFIKELYKPRNLELVIGELKHDNLIFSAFWLNEINEKAPLKKVIEFTNNKISSDFPDAIHYIQTIADTDSSLHTLTKLNSYFSKEFAKDNDKFKLSLPLISKISLAQNLLNEDAISNLINQIDKQYKSNYVIDKIGIVKKINEVRNLSNDQKNLFIKKTLANFEDNDWENMIFWFENVALFLESIDKNQHADLPAKINSRFTFLNQQYKGQRQPLHIKCYKKFLDILFICYIQDINRNDMYNKINAFFTPVHTKEVYFYINQHYQKIITQFPEINKIFANDIITKFTSLNYTESQEFADTIVLLGDSLNNQQVTQIINHIFNLIFGHPQGSETFTNWILKLKTIPNFENLIYSKIDAISDVNQILNYLKFLKNTDDISLVRQIPYKLILSANNNINQIKSYLNIINDSIKEKSVIGETLTKLIETKQGNRNELKILIEISVEYKDLLSKKVFNDIFKDETVLSR